MEITQTEADYLMKLVKQFETQDTIVLGNTYLKKFHPLISIDGREKFSLDVWHSSIVLNKYRFQERARSVIILARVDIGGALHTNPDGVKVLCPISIFIEKAMVINGHIPSRIINFKIVMI